MKKLCYFFAFTILFVSCKNESENLSKMETADMAATESVSYKMAQPISENGSPKIEAKIIKTGRLRFLTSNLNESTLTITTALQKYKGSVDNDNSGKDYNEAVFRNLTIRIPNVHFDAFIAEVSKGVRFFDVKEITATNVTEEFVDISARLKAKKALEERYLQLLSKANKISEILEIEKELAAIREEIEAKEGQLKYLQSQVSMSTVSIEMYTENASGNSATVSYGSKMWNAIKSGFNGISSFFIGILYLWPFILILAIIFIVWKKKWRKNKTS
jgi:hypothetical protein